MAPCRSVASLQKLTYEQLLAALAKLARGPGGMPAFSPVIDGKFLSRAPWQPDAPANSANVPMMIGTTMTETTALIGVGDPSGFSLDDAGLRKKLSTWLPPNEIDRVIAGYRKFEPEASPSDLFFAVTTARRVRQQAWIQAERKAAQNAASVWLYELDWPTQVDGGKWRSPHSLDLAFMFDNVDKSESMVGHGDEQRALAQQMSAAWLAFARTGNPNNKLSPQWPAFRVPERMTSRYLTRNPA